MTGLGIINCLGRGKDQVWDRLLTGRAGYRPVDRPEFQQFRCHTAGQVDDRLLVDLHPAPPARLSRHELLGLCAVQDSLTDAGLAAHHYQPGRFGVAAGIGAAGMLEAEAWLADLKTSGKRHPAHTLRGYPASSLADLVAARHGLKGPRFSIATACSSSGTALGMAADAIGCGRADAYLVVGSEALSLLTYAGFHSLRSMAPDLCCPFDRDRKGLILGEGAAALVLERRDLAAARGARIYGEVLGWGLSSDGHHMTAPHPEGLGAVRAMAQAIARAGIDSDLVGYVNLHGTGTQHNDLAETRAVKNLFGRRARALPLSSSKSMTGHCLGAAGAIESVVTLLALHHETAPPTANLSHPDPECDLDYVPGASRPLPGLRVAMNNVMAFGGNNVALLFGREVA